MWIISALLVVCVRACIDVIDTANNQLLRIEPWHHDALRIRAVPLHDQRFVLRDDLVSAFVHRSNATCTPVALSPGLNVTNGNLCVSLSDAGLLAFSRVSDGKHLLTEKTVRMMTITNSSPPMSAPFLALALHFEAVDGERIYGLGQHKTGQLDNKGVRLNLAPANTEILIPVAHSSLGHAFLFNLPSFGTVEYNDTGTFWYAQSVLQADFWVGTTGIGDTRSPWAQLQGSYADATGHAPVYPEWASGFWQCKNRYHNQSQILDVTNGYVSRGYPLSLMIIDYFSWNPLPLGDEALPPSCWPDPKAMVDQLKTLGVELMISPYFHSVTSASKNYPTALAHGFIVQNSSGQPALGAFAGAYLYDLFQPAARQYAFGKVKEGYMDPYGLHHWWLDCDEPCGSHMDKMVYNNGSWPASLVGAAYPHMLDKMVWEGMAQPGMRYEKDTVMLGRSAWAGSQRYGGAVWSGDTTSDFENLNQQFRAGLNMAMSGIPYWTTDIGGYGGGNIDSSDFRQLIVRWFQWGAFCPLFRNHGRRSGGPSQEGGTQCGDTGGSNEIWNFGSSSEAAIARVMKLREQLRPYVLEQYQLASTEGIPVIRPLFFDFWEDSGAQMIDDQLMFGPTYLVAPQLLANATERLVYLPQLPSNEAWQNIFTGVKTNTTHGGANLTEPTPLQGEGFSSFPLYMRVVTSRSVLVSEE
eukprot:TRINITY_DN1567_c0_g1_i21.p1 TRINITY_DN1567_c0_g1~~TRINITY_DN1567_c0_g1_i21.p1  ORF type:complete len:694 (+),score=84.24 TRINITY_DN1567_c0_g1_i21:184-2265(+)